MNDDKFDYDDYDYENNTLDDEVDFAYKEDNVEHGRSLFPIGILLIAATVFLVIILIGISRLASSTSSVSVTSLDTPNTVPASAIVPTPTAFEAVVTAVPPPTPLPSTPIDEAVLISDAYQPLLPLPPEKRGLIFSGDRTELLVALTFDVGETADNPAGFDQGIIDVLNETDTPATFFLGGLWMMHNEAETRQLAANPLFELGNHAWSHLDFAQITPEEMASEILLTQQQLWHYFGWQTSLFRLPFGTYTEEALSVIADHGLLTVQWDVVSGDPDPNVLAEPMADWVLQQVQPGSIIIMHANGRGWHTAEALPTIIETLHNDGYTFVTISELLNLEPQTPLSPSN